MGGICASRPVGIIPPLPTTKEIPPSPSPSLPVPSKQSPLHTPISTTTSKSTSSPSTHTFTPTAKAPITPSTTTATATTTTMMMTPTMMTIPSSPSTNEFKPYLLTQKPPENPFLPLTQNTPDTDKVEDMLKEEIFGTTTCEIFTSHRNCVNGLNILWEEVLRLNIFPLPLDDDGCGGTVGGFQSGVSTLSLDSIISISQYVPLETGTDDAKNGIYLTSLMQVIELTYMQDTSFTIILLPLPSSLLPGYIKINVYKAERDPTRLMMSIHKVYFYNEKVESLGIKGGKKGFRAVRTEEIEGWMGVMRGHARCGESEG